MLPARRSLRSIERQQITDKPCLFALADIARAREDKSSTGHTKIDIVVEHGQIDRLPPGKFSCTEIQCDEKGSLPSERFQGAPTRRFLERGGIATLDKEHVAFANGDRRIDNRTGVIVVSPAWQAGSPIETKQVVARYQRERVLIDLVDRFPRQLASRRARLGGRAE